MKMSKTMDQKKVISASSEDYLEAIYLICRKNGEARSKEIKERLDVSGPSVTEALQLLSDKKLVRYEPYGAITLTAAGESIAKDVLYRHQTLRDFLITVLGVDPEMADEGACKMEHAVSPAIIERMVHYTRYLQVQSKEGVGEHHQQFLNFLQK